MKHFMRGVVSIILVLAACVAGYASYRLCLLPESNSGTFGFGFLALVLVFGGWMLVADDCK